MLKFYSLLIGENPKYTSAFQPSSKRKIALYGNCLLIPVILWFFNGYMMVRNILECNLAYSLLAGFISAFIILLVERGIIMTNKSTKIMIFRFILGFTIALLGSISIDEIIFKADINNQIMEYKMASINNAINKVDAKYYDKINLEQSIVNRKEDEWNKSLDEAKGEADGTSGSHQKQVGKIAMLKMNIATKKEQDYNIENQKLNSLDNERILAINRTKSEIETNFSSNALLFRIKAMYHLVFNDLAMGFLYVLFLIFLFSLEFIIVLIKLLSTDSIDELLEKERERLLIAKAQKTIEKSMVFYEPEQFFPSVQLANTLVKERLASVL